MNADGSNIVQLTTTGGRAPSWSPDGTRIAVGVTIVPSTTQTAFVINAADGGNPVSLVPGADPAWSPDGSLIALAFCTDRFVCDPDDPVLAVIHPDGTGLTPLPTLNGSYQPAWSPDGSKLAGRLLKGPQAALWSAEYLPPMQTAPEFSFCPDRGTISRRGGPERSAVPARQLIAAHGSLMLRTACDYP
jgi:Tol biopolymer transport system component